MKIPIPRQFRDRFGSGKVYVTRWKDHTLLIMNQEEYDWHVKVIDGLPDTVEVFLRFMKASLIEIELEDGMAVMADGVALWLEGEKRTYDDTMAGLLIK